MSAASVYKILTVREWAEAQGASHIAPTPADSRDGFVHLSTVQQAPVTLQRHFSGEAVVVIVEFAASDLADALKWEANTAGEVYPHFHGILETAKAGRRWRVIRDSAGAFMLPDVLR